MIQLQLDLFNEEVRTPNWDDVRNGSAELYTILEPCDHSCYYYNEQIDSCRYSNTRDQYGMCKAHYIRWKE